MADAKDSTSTSILVTGDVALDWFETILRPNPDPKEESLNWHGHDRILRHCLPGGAFILTELCKQAYSGPVIGPSLAKEIGSIPYGAMVTYETGCLDVTDEGDKAKNPDLKRISVVRKKGCAVLAGQATGEDLIRYPKGSTERKLVILDDSGNGFRDHPENFPGAMGKNDAIVYRMCQPLVQGLAWEQFLLGEPGQACGSNRVAVVDGDILRMAGGVSLSKALSWERTALDFSEQLQGNPVLRALADCPNLVVLLGLDGALWVRSPGGERPHVTTLIFDPTRLEGAWERENPARGPGARMAFLAFMAARIAQEGIATLAEGIQDGLWAARILGNQGLTLRDGVLAHDFEKLDPDSIRKLTARNKSGAEKVGGKKLAGKYFASVAVPAATGLGAASESPWTILEEMTRETRFKIAQAMLRTGAHEGDAAIMDSVPNISFGPLLSTFDRWEIESFSSIRNLMTEYLEQARAGGKLAPFNLAVFGSPGSGKSFAVKEIAKRLNLPKECILTFNLSQFQSYSDLAAAFHRVRDLALEGNVPLIFFDEFDSGFEGKEKGWLKYFLAPMQDGLFRDGEYDHPIGKAIFVFAGGTCATFDAFFPQNPEETKKKELRDAKVPDFVSRLRGKLNILGPNQREYDPIRGADEGFVLRRASILRMNFEGLKKGKAALLFKNGGQHLSIDNSVETALLATPAFRHGHRSLAAILEMSQLSGRRNYDSSALPPDEQMVLHVDPQIFKCYLNENIYTEFARALHEDYVAMRKAAGETIHFAEKYEDLSADGKQANLDAARDIPEKLLRLGLYIRKRNSAEAPAGIQEFSVEQTESSARREHVRWSKERTSQGWTFGAVRDNSKKLHPDLIDYDQLPEKVKEIDREQIRALPRILGRAGYDIRRVGD